MPKTSISATVVVPVFGASKALHLCIESLADSDTPGQADLLFVLDGPQDQDSRNALGRIERSASVVSLAQRSGFAAAVNRGIDESTGDVVLLNSDTIVAGNWVGRLAEAAYSRPQVATVTPWTNNGTICSLPQTLVENDLPRGLSVQNMDEAIRKSSQALRPRIPVGVGFCLYVRREAIDRVGPFNAERFGLGYGEETDFCLRATAEGFVHLLDDSTFVFHKGQGSFGQLRQQRVARAERLIYRKFPGFRQQLAQFINEDALAAPRRTATASFTASTKPSRSAAKVVHLTHGFPPDAYGGTENYVSWLAKGLAPRWHQAVYSRTDRPNRRTGDVIEGLDGSIRIRRIVNRFDQRNPVTRNAISSRLFEKDFQQFLEQEAPKVCHIHHLAGSSLSLAQIASKAAPTILHVHDWWLACPRANLFDHEESLCSGPAVSKCARCIPFTKIEPTGLANLILHRMRTRAAQAVLGSMHGFVFGSEAILNWFNERELLPKGTRTWFAPYEVPPPSTVLKAQRLAESPLRCGFIGALLPHKGGLVAVRAFNNIDPGTATLSVWGNAQSDLEYAERLAIEAGPAVSLRGAFLESKRESVFDSMDLLIVPSLGLESFGLVIAEAASRGIPSVVSDRGALPGTAERTRGHVVPAGDEIALREAVLSYAHTHQPSSPYESSLDDHVSQIESIYKELLC